MGEVIYLAMFERLHNSNPERTVRVFSPSGNPQARNIFEIVAHLQKLESTVLEVVERTAA